MMELWKVKQKNKIIALFYFLNLLPFFTMYQAQGTDIYNKKLSFRYAHLLKNDSTFTFIDLNRKQLKKISRSTNSNNIKRLTIWGDIDSSEIQYINQLNLRSLTIDIINLPSENVGQFNFKNLLRLDIKLPKKVNYRLFWEAISSSEISYLSIVSDSNISVPEVLPKNIESLTLSNKYPLTSLKSNSSINWFNLDKLYLFSYSGNSLIYSSFSTLKSLTSLTMFEKPKIEQLLKCSSLHKLRLRNQIGVDESYYIKLDELKCNDIRVFDKKGKLIYIKR